MAGALVPFGGGGWLAQLADHIEGFGVNADGEMVAYVDGFEVPVRRFFERGRDLVTQAAGQSARVARSLRDAAGSLVDSSKRLLTQGRTGHSEDGSPSKRPPPPAPPPASVLSLQSNMSTSRGNVGATNRLVFKRMPKRLKTWSTIQQLHPMKRRVQLSQEYKYSVRNIDGRIIMAGQIHLNDLSKILSGGGRDNPGLAVTNPNVSGFQWHLARYIDKALVSTYEGDFGTALDPATNTVDNRDEAPVLPECWQYWATMYAKYRVKGVWVVIEHQAEHTTHSSSHDFIVQMNDVDCNVTSGTTTYTTFDALARSAANGYSNDFSTVGAGTMWPAHYKAIKDSPHTRVITVNANATESGNQKPYYQSVYIPCDPILHDLGHDADVTNQVHVSTGNPNPVQFNTTSDLHLNRATVNPSAPAHTLYLRLGIVLRDIAQTSALGSTLIARGKVRLVWDVSFEDPRYTLPTLYLRDDTDETGTAGNVV